MANGDDAVAAGMDKVLGTADRRLGYDEINKTRDYIAQRTSSVQPVAKGGTGATTAAAARTNLGAASDAAMTTALAGKVNNPGTNVVAIYWEGSRLKMAVDGTYQGEIANTGDTAGKARQNVEDGYLNASVYARSLAGSYRVCYVKDDGTLGWVSSSRRYKKNIRPAEVSVDAVLAMELVTFLYKVEIDTDHTGTLQHGLIAEQLDELGLDWLVDYGADGLPEGVRYDRIALALLPVIQQQAAQLAALDARLTALEDR